MRVGSWRSSVERRRVVGVGLGDGEEGFGVPFVPDLRESEEEGENERNVSEEKRTSSREGKGNEKN